jgi:HEAT repeat protein
MSPLKGGHAEREFRTMAERRDLVALIRSPEEFLDHTDPVLRRMAITALSSESCNELIDTVVARLEDESGSVRAAAAERLGECGVRALEHLARATDDADPKVREAIATAYGELCDPSAIGWLVHVANDDPDRTVKEAAVAALGAIGDDSAINPLLGFIASGPPQVRRRAIAAITVFDDPRIETAIRSAAFDRNPGVREAAEMVVGKQLQPPS